MTDSDNNQKYAIVPKWPLDTLLQSVYANQFAITRSGSEYVLEFGEFLPTGFSNRSKEEIQAYLDTATIKPVSRIVVSPNGLKAFFNMLDGYLKKNPQFDQEMDDD